MERDCYANELVEIERLVSRESEIAKCSDREIVELIDQKIKERVKYVQEVDERIYFWYYYLPKKDKSDLKRTIFHSLCGYDLQDGSKMGV